ncbi:hypothetical protein B0H12DRAFT_211745 [Mycena haematopus]|nr:hypothetical protein B0H12DRAFT_211745 [Mycena haematopus]
MGRISISVKVSWHSTMSDNFRRVTSVSILEVKVVDTTRLSWRRGRKNGVRTRWSTGEIVQLSRGQLEKRSKCTGNPGVPARASEIARRGRLISILPTKTGPQRERDVKGMLLLINLDSEFHGPQHGIRQCHRRPMLADASKPTGHAGSLAMGGGKEMLHGQREKTPQSFREEGVGWASWVSSYGLQEIRATELEGCSSIQHCNLGF